jgi:hypothetical protein
LGRPALMMANPGPVPAATVVPTPALGPADTEAVGKANEPLRKANEALQNRAYSEAIRWFRIAAEQGNARAALARVLISP